MHIFSNIAGAY